MKTFNVPYAKGFVDINIPNQNIAGVLESKAIPIRLSFHKRHW